MKYFKFPHTYVLLVLLIIIASFFTYLIPSGEFKRVEDTKTGQTELVPGSFHHIESSAVSLLQVPKMIVKGLNDSADIIMFIFIVGGAFQIITATGTINAITGRIANRFQNKDKLIIPIFLTLFSIGGFSMGMSTECMVFVPIGIAVARSLGYDALVGTAMVSLGAAVGFTAGLLNPFNVGIAQTIAQIPMFSGLWLRAILLVVLLIITSYYVIRYAQKVKKNPDFSYVADLEKEQDNSPTLAQVDIPKMEIKHYFVLLTLVVGFGGLVWGVSTQDWWIEELSALFLSMGIVAGFLSKFGPSKVAKEFVIGAKAMTYGALIIGLARGILMVFEEGHIIDSIVYSLSGLIGHLPSSIQVLGMYFFQTIMNVFITSGTGLAATTMPIMVPLADLIHVTRQTAVLAYQMGDGFTNIILPTSSMLMGSLSVSGISYQKWVKFMWPLMIVWVMIGAVFVIVANLINYT
jgi:uncharacterized ion transporter superfamily protein YfcC